MFHKTYGSTGKGVQYRTLPFYISFTNSLHLHDNFYATITREKMVKREKEKIDDDSDYQIVRRRFL